MFCGDTSVITMATDLAGVSGCNTASPVVSSASYNFVAGDVGGYAYVAAGTNWIPGWYPIVSVASNQATLNAAIGAVTLTSLGLNTTVGCATTATPTGGTWTVDYSRSTTARYTYTDLTAAGSGSTFTSVGNPFGPNCPGNTIAISSGTNVTVQRAMILSVSTVMATFDKAVTTGVTTNGAGKLGGCLATVGQAGALFVAENTLWLKYNAAAFTATSTTSNIAAGRLTLTAGIITALSAFIGYDVTRGDQTANRPSFKWDVNAASAAVLTVANFCRVFNIILDGNRANRTSTRGLAGVSATNVIVERCKFTSFSSGAVNLSTTTTVEFMDCEFTDCVTNTVLLQSNSGKLILKHSSFHDNTATCFDMANCVATVDSVAFWNNTGVTTDAITTGGGQLTAIDLTIATIGRHGINFSVASQSATVSNSYVEGAGGYGYNFAVAMDCVRLINCAGNNTNASGNITPANFGYAMNIQGFINLAATAFVNLSAGNLMLNTGAGALLRASGFKGSYPGLPGLNYSDIGAYQHQDPQFLRGRTGF